MGITTLKLSILVSIVYLVNNVQGRYAPHGRPKSREPLVSTNLGQIQPAEILFRPPTLPRKMRKTVLAYLGIPYAEPPVEGRRFQPPEPILSWGDEVLDATVNPSPCPQIREPDYVFSEDCLYLNVYVPETAPPNAAVMVYIHGGSLKVGSSTDYPVNPIPLAAVGDVIVVTLNYRVNIFGFFTTGGNENGIPPNLGLLDQRLALRWVYENIQAFGGDPEKVTLFGESAGAVSISWHVLSEESRRYFQRAILQSGSPLNPWARVLSQDDVIQTETLVGGVGGCADSVADCLKSKTVEELLSIVGTIDQMYPTAVIFTAANDGSFLTGDIPSLIQDGSYSDIDMLLGSNRDEGTFVSMVFTGRPQERPLLTRDHFALYTQTSGNDLLLGLLEAIYSDGIDGIDYEGAISSAFGDVWFTCGIDEFAREVSSAGSNVYMYRLTHEPKTSVWGRDWLGVTHGEELQFIFGLPLLDDENSRRSGDVKMSVYIIRMWANFAKSGNPNTPSPFPPAISEWPLFLPDTEIYKELDLNFSNEQMLREHYCNFWDNLVPQIVQLQVTAAVAAGDASG